MPFCEKVKFEDVMEPGKSFLWRKSGLQTAESWPEKKGLEPGERIGGGHFGTEWVPNAKGYVWSTFKNALALSTSYLLLQYKRKNRYYK